MQNASYAQYIFEVRVNGKKAEEILHAGEYFIEGRKGSQYELYFRNNTYKRVLVVFSVDGLSTMDGKTASDNSGGYIVNAYSEIKVPGWKIDSKKVAHFEFRPQNDKANTTYVELLQEEGFDVDVSNQGVIGCMVFDEKVKPIPQYQIYNTYIPPVGYVKSPAFDINTFTQHGLLWGGARSPETFYNEVNTGIVSSSSLRGVNSSTVTMNASQAYATAAVGYSEPIAMASASPSLGTGFGEDTRFETRTVEFENEKNPSWIGVINYDTIQGLRKRGIYVASSNAKAFPGYKENGCHVPQNRR
jgi:hypothetical protein